jgi:RHS repeat-associated protein
MRNHSSTPTYFVGNYYENTSGVATKYYYAGSQRIALRKMNGNNILKFLIGDHLGSTSIVVNASGVVINQTQYKAWGETRYTSGTEQTKYQYTGQYSYVSDFGLHFYNARWYDSSLSRFAQADTIIPAGMHGLDRYAYVNNAPLNFIDPTGHDAWWCQTALCQFNVSAQGAHGNQVIDGALKSFNIKTNGLNKQQKIEAVNAAQSSGETFYKAFGSTRGYESPADAYVKLHGEVTISYDSSRSANCETTNIGNGNSSIACASSALNFYAFLHEFGHSMDIHLGGKLSDNLIAFDTINGEEIDGGDGNPWIRTINGFACSDFRCLGHPPSLKYCESLSSYCARQEQSADLYMNYILHFTGDPNHGFRGEAGTARLDDYGNRLLPTVFDLYFP